MTGEQSRQGYGRYRNLREAEGDDGRRYIREVFIASTFGQKPARPPYPVLRHRQIEYRTPIVVRILAFLFYVLLFALLALLVTTGNRRDDDQPRRTFPPAPAYHVAPGETQTLEL